MVDSPIFPYYAASGLYAGGFLIKKRHVPLRRHMPNNENVNCLSHVSSCSSKEAGPLSPSLLFSNERQLHFLKQCFRSIPRSISNTATESIVSIMMQNSAIFLPPRAANHISAPDPAQSTGASTYILCSIPKIGKYFSVFHSHIQDRIS